ncbi:MAG: collagen-like protein, partial [bacterium]|nr:collagen-like protein [bacterium]
MANASLHLELYSQLTLARNQSILFDTLRLYDNNILYDWSTGIATFTILGRYQVEWWVSTEMALNTDAIIFAMDQDGALVYANSPVKTGQLTGVALIYATPGSTVTIKNVSTGSEGTVFLGNIVPLKASLVITCIEDTVGPIGPAGPEGPAGATGPEGPMGA